MPENLIGIIVFAVIFIIIALILGYTIRIVPQAEAYVVERLGAYSATWTTGVHFVMPFVDRIANKLTLKEIVKDFDPQPVITKDNVTMQIDTVVYFQITDPKLYTYGVVGPITAIENLTATTLRNIIGDLELDETLTSRDIINTQMRAILDEATDPWGIKVNRVEVKNIIPPRDIQEAMEKQMRAERERREAILKAEGEKKSAILVAEGEKESTVLRAEAKKAALIAEAEGKAQAIQAVYEAEARGIELINNAAPSKEYLSIKSLETYEKMANGQATKIVVPSEMQGVASLLTSAKELVSKDK
ncbi:MAG: SPFH/Band 7/PHB domain protein [Erysipelotrichaceae bacterium]|nr:SPFH/Band 7/PHB domain protein [Erysipelotrichaceae bacterium]